MKTIKDVFYDYRQVLSGTYESSEIEALTLLVISEVCQISKAKIKAFPEEVITSGADTRLTEILSELQTGKPIQYILGTTEFYGLPFHVDPSVLIPRPETEELVEWIIKTVRSSEWAANSGQLSAGNGKQALDEGEHKFGGNLNLLDIGTGSGCIAIALKKNLPNFNVTAIDISVEALKIAASNAKLNEVDILFIEADILKEKSQISNLKSQISIIVSNPPYVTLHDKTQMHCNVIDFEPHTALFVPENDPLLFYKAIADFALENLQPNGHLFFEINENFGNQTVELLTNKGYKNIELRKDMSGRDRMAKGTL